MLGAGAFLGCDALASVIVPGALASVSGVFPESTLLKEVQTLTQSEVASLSLAQLAGLSASQIALMSVEQLSALSYWQIRVLTPERNTVLSAAQLAALDKPFTEEGANAVTVSVAVSGRDGDVGLLDLTKAVQSGTSNYGMGGPSSWAWRFIEGQQIPAWLQMGSSGLLRAAAPESVLNAGSVAATPYWVEGIETQQGVVMAPRYAKVQVVKVDFAKTVLVDLSARQAGQDLNLDLNAAVSGLAAFGGQNAVQNMWSPVAMLPPPFSSINGNVLYAQGYGVGGQSVGLVTVPVQVSNGTQAASGVYRVNMVQPMPALPVTRLVGGTQGTVVDLASRASQYGIPSSMNVWSVSPGSVPLPGGASLSGGTLFAGSSAVSQSVTLYFDSERGASAGVSGGSMGTMPSRMTVPVMLNTVDFSAPYVKDTSSYDYSTLSLRDSVPGSMQLVAPVTWEVVTANPSSGGMGQFWMIDGEGKLSSNGMPMYPLMPKGTALVRGTDSSAGGSQVVLGAVEYNVFTPISTQNLYVTAGVTEGSVLNLAEFVYQPNGPVKTWTVSLEFGGLPAGYTLQSSGTLTVQAGSGALNGKWLFGGFNRKNYWVRNYFPS
jgi:hypothetical protein